MPWCTLLVVLTAFTTTAGAQLIDEWLVAGPVWGRGAGAAVSNGYESRLSPNEGDHLYDFRTDQRRLRVWEVKPAEDGWLDFFSDNFPQVAARWKDGAYPWAGAAMYAVSYIESDRDQRVKLAIESPQEASIWVNGRAVDDAIVSLERGWNRLVVKVPSPSKVRGVEPQTGDRSNWSLRVRIEQASADADPLTLATSDPERETVILDDGRVIRVLATLGTRTNDFPVFYASEPMEMPYRVEAALGPAENYALAPERIRGWPWVYSTDPQHAERLLDAGDDRVSLVKDSEWQKALPNEVRLTLLDYDLQVVERRVLGLAFEPADRSSRDLMVHETLIRFEGLSVGHYTLVSEFVTSGGKVWARDNDHSFSIVPGPVDTAGDRAPRYLGNIGHHLANSDDGVAERVEWLRKAGITRQFKLSQSWSRYGAKHDGQGNVEVARSEKMDKALRLLYEAGITPVGDLIVGSPVRETDPSQTPALTEADQKAAQAAARRLGADQLPVIQPPGARPLPAFGTEAFEKTVYDYAFHLVDTYKDQIKHWSGMNEIDLHSTGTEVEARVLAEAQKIAYRAAKDADPEAIIIAPSLVRGAEFVDMLLEAGFAEGADILDVHAHPANAPDLHRSTVLGNTGTEGVGAVRPYLESSGVDKPVWYGEISAPLAHAPRGVKGQAEAVVKQLCWAIENPHVEAINYLVMYNSPTYWGANLGFNNFYGEPHPAVNAINTASHLIDGRERLEPIQSIPKGVSHLRFRGETNAQTLVVWSDNKQVDLELEVSGDEVSVIDVIGRRRGLTVDRGRVVISVGVSPVYVIAERFAD